MRDALSVFTVFCFQTVRDFPAEVSFDELEIRYLEMINSRWKLLLRFLDPTCTCKPSVSAGCGKKSRRQHLYDDAAAYHASYTEVRVKQTVQDIMRRKPK